LKEQIQSAIKLLEALTERAKELTCLYAIEEALREPDADIDLVCNRIIDAIPPGWQYPDVCVANITLEGRECRSRGFEETPWQLSANIVQQDRVVGTIGVYYTQETPPEDIGPFLKEEKKLIETIADRINHFLTYKKMKHVLQEWQIGDRDPSENGRSDWEAVLDLIRQTDNALFLRISNKMLNHLCWSGIEEADALRRTYESQGLAVGDLFGDEAKERRLSRLLDFSTEFTERIFQLAATHLSREEILARIQMWIQEDKLGALLRTVRGHLPLSVVSNELRRYFFASREDTGNRYPLARGLKVLLIESVLSGRLDYIGVAKDSLDIEDLYGLLQKVIFSKESHGKLGCKGGQLFLASQILNKAKSGTASGSSSRVEVPETWHISSDMMLEFIHYNNMDEVVEQKYKDIQRVRLEYPHVLEMFRQAIFPADIANGLSMALDDLGEGPLVVRGSSLLEDRTGCPFVGKYKTVFLGNQGTREKRLSDIMTAVAEVYASNFGPDPIAYRAERGMLELSEQIGIMIQKVVGTRVGPYFFPAYTGVARSRNNLRWVPGIEETDGIVRIVPGLGTRASDRSGGEYPVLIVPGGASFQAGGRPDGACHAPRHIDVINLETNRLQTLELRELFVKYGDAFPAAKLVVSAFQEGRVVGLDEAGPAIKNKDLVATFDGLASRSPFAAQIRELLRSLEKRLGVPVEVEFASDGERLYLLQCRPQRLARAPRPAPIPKDVTEDKLVFSARRYVSNGSVANVSHIVCLNPNICAAIDEPERRQAVAQALAKLNVVLPKRQFIVMRPRRWREGDDDWVVRSVTSGSFDNAAVLVDLLDRHDTADDASAVGIHFLQDLLESGVLYVPVFRDGERACFNERFLLRSHNVLRELLPQFASLDEVVRVIDVPKATDGKVVHVFMNAELGEAVGLLGDPEHDVGAPEEGQLLEDEHTEDYWRWRYRMAEQIALLLPPDEFGIEGVYLFGSTKNGTAGPASDIDMLFHFKGSQSQRKGLVRWLTGWSLCLDEVNYLRTGYRSGGLLDFHVITDKDIANKTSYAVKINAVTDAARPLKIQLPGNHEQRVRTGRAQGTGKGVDQ
jgi:pyruvate,water dikinase